MNINTIKQYIPFSLSLILLLLAILFSIQKAYIEPLEKYEKTISFLSNAYRDDELALNKKLFDLSKDQKNEKVELAIIPELLHKINNTCKAPDVVIRKLIPNKDNPFRFELEFISNYFNFIKVLSEFEKLDILINQIDIKPYEINKNNPKHIMTLDIQAIEGAEELSSKVAAYLEKEINKKNKRNPFQRFAKLDGNIERIIDLTWIHKLSSIGKINNNKIATIDRKQYYINDYFNKMKITDIQADKVTFIKKSKLGVTKYIIKFRLTNKNENNIENKEDIFNNVQN